MSPRRPRTQQPEPMFELTCITGCEATPVNSIRKYRDRKPEMAYRCREHTSRFDIVLLGPGPLVGETRRG